MSHSGMSMIDMSYAVADFAPHPPQWGKGSPILPLSPCGKGGWRVRGYSHCVTRMIEKSASELMHPTCIPTGEQGIMSQAVIGWARPSLIDQNPVAWMIRVD